MALTVEPVVEREKAVDTEITEEAILAARETKQPYPMAAEKEGIALRPITGTVVRRGKAIDIETLDADPDRFENGDIFDKIVKAVCLLADNPAEVRAALTSESPTAVDDAVAALADENLLQPRNVLDADWHPAPWSAATTLLELFKQCLQLLTFRQFRGK